MLHLIHESTAHRRLHELAGILELLEKPVDLGDRGTASFGDSLAAAAVDHLRMLALIYGH